MRYLITTAIMIVYINNASAQEKIIETFPEHMLYIYGSDRQNIDQPGALDQLWANKRRWKSGQNLKICFFGGDSSVRRLISSVANEWTNYANLKFDFGGDEGRDCGVPGSGFSQIRIGFSERGYWSAVGRDSETSLNNLQPSMNLQQFDQKYNEINYNPINVVNNSDADDRGIILHEFGHAIGLLHEHQNPKMDCYNEIKWSGPNNVYTYLSKSPNFWNKNKVDRNLGPINIADPDYKAGEPDPKSNMMYSLDPNIFVNGVDSPCYVAQNNVLSSKDKQIAAKLYPKVAAAVVENEGQDNLISKNDFAATPINDSIALAKDYRERIIQDLGSDDTTIRRNARARLASYLADNASPSEIKSIIDAMKVGSYRYQLGVAVALNGAKLDNKAIEKYKNTLVDVYKSTSDKTLRNELTKSIGPQ